MPIGGDGDFQAGRAFPVGDGFGDFAVGDPARLYEHGPDKKQQSQQPRRPGGDSPAPAQTGFSNNMDALFLF
jgi:hypothetical protein